MEDELQYGFTLYGGVPNFLFRFVAIANNYS